MTELAEECVDIEKHIHEQKQELSGKVVELAGERQCTAAEAWDWVRGQAGTLAAHLAGDPD